MAAEIRKKHPNAVIELVGGGRGDFIVSVEDQSIWDKRGVQGRFPEAAEILEKLA